MTLRAVGSLLLGVGFLAGSYTVVGHVHHIEWLHYGVCAGLMVAGMICLRIARRPSEEQHRMHEARIDHLSAAIERLLQRVESYRDIQDDEALLGLHHRIDDELVVDFNAFVEARESMIPRFGMQTYAEVMSPFATGERLINRAWSASVDGYVDEVRDCVEHAQRELGRARDRLSQARG